MNEKPIMIFWLLCKLTPIIASFLFLCLAINQCTDNSHDIDNEAAAREIFTVQLMVDSTGNGFELTYSTKNPVTKSRLAEMSERNYIKDNIDSLKIKTKRCYGSLLYTDIYEYADFALSCYIDSNLVIEEILVYGREKSNLYIGENPKISNSARWLDPYTNQGLLYIKHDDIYYRRGNERVYRYKNCTGVYGISTTDEYFSHFSEDERLR